MTVAPRDLSYWGVGGILHGVAVSVKIRRMDSSLCGAVNIVRRYGRYLLLVGARFGLIGQSRVGPARPSCSGACP
jgi:hypothetical protein